MDLSFRLQKIADAVNNNSIVADIGTDHAYIPIYLCKKNVIKKAIACDISKGSLEKAKTNILNYNLQNNIDARLSNGLESLSLADNISDIIIAGMGGMLMIDILERGHSLVQNIETLILQPQKDIDRVRKYIHKIGFFIENDSILTDDGKYYNIIVAKKGLEKTPYTKQHYMFGKFQIEEKNSVLKAYLKEQLAIMETVLQNIENAGAKSENTVLSEKFNLYKEVLKCL